VLVDPVLPPAAGDLLDILPVARAAFALDAVENVLPVLEIGHRGLQLGQFLFQTHRLSPFSAVASSDSSSLLSD
jgi:hypothetical protein